MAGKRITLEVTPAQLRLINSGLALIEADPEEAGHRRQDDPFIKRTRSVVHHALEASGVRP